MSIDIDFKKHSTVLIMVKETQEAETDARQAVRDAKLFLNKRDGQWDPYSWQKLDGRFRGTFDMCTPIVDSISGEIEESDFSLKVSPSGGDSSIETAKIYNGLIRNIRNISNADAVFNDASRSNVVGGFDAFEIVQEFIDGDSFDQDLMIKKVANAVDSVWFDLGSVQQDRSDAKWCVKLVAIPAAQYKERWPDGSNTSVSDDRRSEAYFNKSESVVVGQLYYKKPENIELVRMTDGSVYRDDDKFQSVQDELLQSGITIELDNEGNEKRRTRKGWRVHTRMFDGSDWLNKEEKTVFSDLPLIPLYGNFDIFENKTIYYGSLEKLYDSQRVLNYAMSRDIEDGALSPSPSIWMTEEQAQGNDYSKMNTDHHPIRIYNHVDGQQFMPQTVGGPMPSSGLQTTIANTQQMISASANSFNAQQGNANALQSGIAGAQQIEQGQSGSIKWFKSLQVAVCQAGKVLINAIPRVYDSTRQVRILEEDGSSKMEMLNQTVFDQQSQTNVELNDLSKGDFDVVCDYGPAFNSQQKETAQAFLDMSAIDPSFLQEGKDIMLKNLAVPGMDQMAERARVQLLNAGMIPETQWTDEERQQIEQQQAEQANQPPQEDPMMIAARAEEGKAQAEQMTAQTRQQEAQFNAQVKQAEISLEQDKIALDREKLQLDAAKFARSGEAKYNTDLISADQSQQKIDLDVMKAMNDMAIKIEQLEQQYNQNLKADIRENQKLANEQLDNEQTEDDAEA
tara:strand:+ start:85 stop:2298 length:2214 start_codon:yes stop_codon:yes gene_type:complete